MVVYLTKCKLRFVICLILACLFFSFFAELALGMALHRRRVLALPFPMQGHINPLLSLCQRLASRSIDVTFVNTERNHERLLRSPDSPASKEFGDGVITFVALPDGLPSTSFDGGANEMLNAALVASDRIEKPFQELVQGLVRDDQVDIACIISDGYLGWTQDVASKFNIPRVAFWSSNVAYNLVNYHLQVLIDHGYAARKPGSVEFDDSQLVTCIPGLEPLHPRDLPSVIHYDSENDPGFRKRIARVRRMKEAAWVLVNTFEDIEAAGVRAMQAELRNYTTVGPFLERADLESRISMWNEDTECLSWLDRQEPKSVLYVSFGSIANLSCAQFKLLATGIESSRQPFLWGLRLNMLPPECEEFSREFISRTSAQGLVVEWTPQLKVLQHVAVGAHLSHCGWNSLLESMLCGVPVLGWPCVAEQTMNCKRVAEDWKIGLRFSRNPQDGLVSSSEVSRVIKCVFEQEQGGELRNRARDISSLARTAAEGSGRMNLERFAHAVASGFPELS